MHDIEPFYNWLKYYDSSQDSRSPFFGKEYNYDLYQDTIYGFFIDPGWDTFGSETLYLKILYADYEEGYIIVEFLGEWNDALDNDIMLLKRNFIEVMAAQGIAKFILIGENILNFHGSDDSYYEEWFENVEDASPPGWIAAIGFPEFIQQEMKKFGVDKYINMGGTLQIEQWRTFTPANLFIRTDALIQRRLN
jgi:hypothetical protein